MKTIAQILSFLKKFGVEKISSFHEKKSDYLIKNLCQNHLMVNQQDVFIAFKGKKYDGHQYVNDVLAKGIKLVLLEDISLINNNMLSFILKVPQLKSVSFELANWFYDEPSKKQHIIAVTGTNGKTSICYFLAQILTELSNKVGMLSTIGNGIFPRLLFSELTTLDNLRLQMNLKQFYNQGARIVVMEASSHAIDQNRIAKLNIETAIFSNLDIDHLDYHQTMENYFQAKLKLFTAPNINFCVINIDDIYGKRLFHYLTNQTKKNVFKFSLIDSSADCYMPIKSINKRGFIVDIFFQNKRKKDIIIPIIGMYNLSNLAATLCTLFINNYDFFKVLEIISYINTAKGRLEKIVSSTGKEALVLIDYAHTPDALAKTLKTVKLQINSNKGKLYCIFGCGGLRDRSKRPLMAKVAQKYADFVIVTEDNSRIEKVKDIINDIISGFDVNFSNFLVIEDRKQAIEYALKKSCFNDVILLAGKGHEHYLDKGNQRIYFCESEVVVNFWKNRYD